MIEGQYRFYGTRASRAAVGWNPYVNNALPENVPLSLPQGVAQAGMGAMNSAGTYVNIGVDVIVDTARYQRGEYDEAHYSYLDKV